MSRTVVLIPCYNECHTIEKVVTDWKKALPDATIYVYDNNSTDGTDKIALNAGAVVRYEHRQGKGNVLRRMFREIEADCYILVDGDDTYPVEQAKEFRDSILDECYDMVIGDRLSATYYQENTRPFHNLGNASIKRLINHLFKSDIQDVFTGYRAFSYQFVKTFPILSTGFEIETEMTIHAVDKNMSIKTIPVQYRDRPEGSVSKLDTIPDGLRVIKTMLYLYKDYKPWNFFSGIALFMVIVAILFFVPVFLEYLATGLVPRLPTLVVCGFCVIAALISFFSGLILQTVININRKRFEIDLVQVNQFKILNASGLGKGSL